MTTRRNFLTLLGAGAATALVGCEMGTVRGDSPGLAQQSSPPDVLTLDTADGLAVLRGGEVEAYGLAIATPDGGTIHAVRAAGVDTDLLRITTRTGQITDLSRLPGAWVPSIAAGDSRTVALVPPTLRDGAGRDRTPVLIAAAAGPRRLDLAGNYAPDAFSPDSQAMYVLDWLPAGAPDHYRVREIDLATSTPTPLMTRDKQPAEELDMRGVRRNAVFGTGDEVLYTLYTRPPGDGEPGGWPGAENAFIHTLHLAQHWAYCVNLPAPFGFRANAGHALAIAPDGQRLYVADCGAGRLAVVETESLYAAPSLALPADPGSAYAVATRDSLFVGVGRLVRVVDLKDHTVRATWELAADVVGLVASPDESRIYIGLDGRVEWHDSHTGALLGRTAELGLTGLRSAR